MALPASGPISISAIRTELSNTGKTNNVSLRLIGKYEYKTDYTLYVPINQSSSSKPNLANPFSLGEWYSYNHSATINCSTSTYTTPSLVPFMFNTYPPPGDGIIYYKFTVTGNAGDVFYYTFNVLDTSLYGIQMYIFNEYPFDSSGNISNNWLDYVQFWGGGEFIFENGMLTSTTELHFVIFAMEYLEVTGGPETISGSTGLP